MALKIRHANADKNIIAISTGVKHTVGLRADGSVVATGSNENGQCNVSGLTDIISIVAFDFSTFALKSNGTVITIEDPSTVELTGCVDVTDKSYGYNWKNVSSLIKNDGFYALALSLDGTLFCNGSKKNLSNWKGIVSASSNLHIVGLKSNGTVVATGSNDYGECDTQGWRNIVEVAAGFGYTIGLKVDGTVVAVGKNDNGQCDVNEWTDIVAISVSNYCTVGLKSDGTVVATGNSQLGQCNVSGWKLFNNIDSIVQEKASAKAKLEFEDKQQKIIRKQKEKEAKEKCIYLQRLAEEERLRQETESAANRQKQIMALKKERESLQSELANLKGFFTGKRRKEIEHRLAAIEEQLRI